MFAHSRLGRRCSDKTTNSDYLRVFPGTALFSSQDLLYYIIYYKGCREPARPV